NTIVFGTMENLRQVSADGGSPAALTTVDAAKNESYHHVPQLVASTGDILFTVSDNEGQKRIDVLRQDTGARSTVLSDVNSAVLTSSGHLVFHKDGSLMAAPFDAQKRTAGPAVPLAESVVVDSTLFNTPQLAVS